jgi:pimeloyl-ACP methyl ester carboxylesterase
MPRPKHLSSDPVGVLAVVEGRKFYIHRSGDGSPTIVLDTGLGGTSSHWALVQEGIAKFTTVCSYDRAGIGRSQRGEEVRDANHIASDLNALLLATGQTPPYIVVGHSAGGLYAHVFASRYPALVAGLVLVDPTPLDFSLKWYVRAMAALMLGALPTLSRLGLQVMRAQMESLGGDLPEDARAELRAAHGSPGHLAATRDEFRALDVSLAQAKDSVLAHDLPVLVLSAELASAPSQSDLVKRAQAEHARFAAMFDEGRHRVIAGSNHLSLVTDRRFAAEIAEEIRLFVDRVSAKKRLTR